MKCNKSLAIIDILDFFIFESIYQTNQALSQDFPEVDGIV